MNLRFFCALLPILLLVGCDDDDSESPTQQTMRQLETARQDVRHAYRLRDIDRLTCEAGKLDLQSQTDTMRGLCIGLLVLVLAAMAWLGFEVRRRRILKAIVVHQTQRNANSR
jgi:hypothetical protein